MEVVGEGVEEGSGCQAAEGALQVKEVGGTAADEGAMVRHVGQQLSAVGRTAKGLLIGVEDGDVATVAGQRVKRARAQRRRYSEKRTTLLLTPSRIIRSISW